MVEQNPIPGITPKRRGRPKGKRSTATRDKILRAAVQEFNQRGYEAASLRAMARRAEVDPALIHHYFEDKAALFLEVVKAPLNPGTVIANAMDGPREAYGERLVRGVLGIWGNPRIRPGASALLRSVLSSKSTMHLMRPFLQHEMLHRISGALQGTDSEHRAALAASQLVGLIMARYILELDPLATASDEEVVASVAPVIQWYLTGKPPGN